MTDLTPEQIDQWANDGEAKKNFEFSLSLGFHRLKKGEVPTSSEALGALHAHARILQLEAENARLEKEKAMLAYMVHTHTGWTPSFIKEQLEQALEQQTWVT